MPPSAGACQTTDADDSPDCGRAALRSSIITAIGCWAATAGVTRRPVSGAGTRTGVGSGVAVGSGVGEAVTVGSGVPVGLRVAVGVGTAVACASGDAEGAEALSTFAPTPITSAARATTPTPPTMALRFTPLCLLDRLRPDREIPCDGGSGARVSRAG